MNLLTEKQMTFLLRNGFEYRALSTMTRDQGQELIAEVYFNKKHKRAAQARRQGPRRAEEGAKLKDAGHSMSDLSVAKTKALEKCEYACESCGQSYRKDGVRTKCYVLDYQKLDILVQCDACREAGVGRPKIIKGFQC